jgi:5-formyltetrahydrofolate cyclo-ligase
MEDSKSVLRSEYRQKRSAYFEFMSPREKSICFSSAPSPLKQLFAQAKIVASYIPIGSEANANGLLEIAASMGCKTALPYVSSRASPMQFLSWNPGDTLIEGAFQLMQPDSAAPTVVPDLLLVPLVAFDRNLNRIGQGAGHYDRALSILDGAITVGVAWSVQEAPAIPADPWDIPLHAILTEKEWITL